MEEGLLRWLCCFYSRRQLLKPQIGCDGVGARILVGAAVHSTLFRRCRIHGPKASHRIFRYLSHPHIIDRYPWPVAYRSLGRTERRLQLSAEICIWKTIGWSLSLMAVNGSSLTLHTAEGVQNPVIEMKLRRLIIEQNTWCRDSSKATKIFRW